MPGPPPPLPTGNGETTFDWNPISWVKDAVNGATGIAKNIRNWVISEVKKAGDILDKEVRAVANLAHKDINNVFGDLTKLEKKVDRIVVSAGGDIGKALGTLEHLIVIGVNDATRGLRGVIDGTWHQALNWYHDALKAASSDVAWAEKHVIDPAIHDLEVGLKDVEKQAVKAADSCTTMSS